MKKQDVLKLKYLQGDFKGIQFRNDIPYKYYKTRKKQIVRAKWITHGLMTSIINPSIFWTMVVSASVKFNFNRLDLPLKQLWYLGNVRLKY